MQTNAWEDQQVNTYLFGNAMHLFLKASKLGEGDFEVRECVAELVIDASFQLHSLGILDDGNLDHDEGMKLTAL